MLVINLTPHPIEFRTGAEAPVLLTIPPSGQLARCAEHITPTPPIHIGGVDIPTVEMGFGEVEGFPEPAEGTIYIASALAAQEAWAMHREDVFAVADTVRDARGRIIGCRALARRPMPSIWMDAILYDGREKPE